jgi:hypothetical protein
MDLTEIFRGLGRERFEEQVKSVSMGSLKTYRLFESFKIHARLGKLNRERLRKAAPQLWTRIEGGDETLAKELAQAVLLSHLGLVVGALDLLGIPHDGNGFYDKSAASAENLTEGWKQRILEHFRGQYPEPVVLLYVNHLDWELGKPAEVFVGDTQGTEA